MYTCTHVHVVYIHVCTQTLYMLHVACIHVYTYNYTGSVLYTGQYRQKQN